MQDPISVTGIMTNSMESDDYLEPYRDFYLAAQWITGLLLYPIICTFGLAGNIITIIVLRGKKIESTTSILLIALSISDGIKLITDMFYFLVIVLLQANPPTGEQAFGYLYPYAHYFFNMSVCTTAWLTVFLAAERYILVCHAVRAKQMYSVWRARLVAGLTFVSMSLLALPFAFRYETAYEYTNSSNQISAVKIQVS